MCVSVTILGQVVASCPKMFMPGPASMKPHGGPRAVCDDMIRELVTGGWVGRRMHGGPHDTGTHAESDAMATEKQPGRW